MSQVAGKAFSFDHPNILYYTDQKNIDIWPMRHLHDYIVSSEKLQNRIIAQDTYFT